MEVGRIVCRLSRRMICTLTFSARTLQELEARLREDMQDASLVTDDKEWERRRYDYAELFWYSCLFKIATLIELPPGREDDTEVYTMWDLSCVECVAWS